MGRSVRRRRRLRRRRADRPGLHDGRADGDDGKAAAGRGDRHSLAQAREIHGPPDRRPALRRSRRHQLDDTFRRRRGDRPTINRRRRHGPRLPGTADDDLRLARRLGDADGARRRQGQFRRTRDDQQPLDPAPRPLRHRRHGRLGPARLLSDDRRAGEKGNRPRHADALRRPRTHAARGARPGTPIRSRRCERSSRPRPSSTDASRTCCAARSAVSRAARPRSRGWTSIAVTSCASPSRTNS